MILKQSLKLFNFSFVAFLLLWGTVSVAQSSLSETEPDYKVWEAIAAKVEATLSSRTASEVYLNLQREKLSQRLIQFKAAQALNSVRLTNTRAQLRALGAIPADGEIEAPEISARRSDLQSQINELSVPGIRATEAFARATAILSEIDNLISNQKTERLLRLGPTPADVRLWSSAITEISKRFNEVAQGISKAWNTPALRTKLRDNAPLIILLIGTAALLFSQGPRWISRLYKNLKGHQDVSSHGLASYIRSLGDVGVAYLGFYLISIALLQTRLVDMQLENLLGNFLLIALPFFTARWLAFGLFPKNGEAETPLGVPVPLRQQARLLTFFIGLVISIHFVMVELQGWSTFSEHTFAVQTFVLVTAAAVSGFRLGQLVLIGTASIEPNFDIGTRHRIVARSVQGLQIICGVSVLLALIGYSSAASTLLFSALLSVGLIAGLNLTFEAVRDFSALLSSDSASGHDGLFAVAVNAGLILLSLPIFALLWGASVSDLSDIWLQFQSGIKLGDVQISPQDFLTLIFVFIVGYFATRLIQRTLKNKILPKTKVDSGGQNAIVAGFGYVGIFAAALVAITSAGLDLSSLAIVAGALSVGIGFGLQNIVSNFVSGIILLIERPISVGDWIQVGGNMGIVNKISVRSTRIETFDRTEVIVPNADLVSGTVTNFTRGNSVGRIILSIGVAYGNDTRKIEALLKPLAAAHPLVLSDPPPSVIFKGFGADSLDFEIRVLLADINNGLSVKSELNHQIYEELNKHGIEIPFSQRDIWIRNPEVFNSKAKG